ANVAGAADEVMLLAPYYARARAARNRGTTRLDRTCVRSFAPGEWRVEVVCAECNTTLRAGARFCDGCGPPVPGPGAATSAAPLPRSLAARPYPLTRLP